VKTCTSVITLTLVLVHSVCCRKRWNLSSSVEISPPSLIV